MDTDHFAYFDYAAATPLDDAVLQAMRPYLSQQFYNPSATYGPAREVAAQLLQARGSVARWLGCRTSEVLFTAGGTEANNIAIHGTMAGYPDANIVVSAIEHDAVLLPACRYDCRIADVDPQGVIDMADLRNKVDDNTVLVSVMYANNEIGTIQPIRDIARLVAEVRDQRRKAGNSRPLYLHSDACQAANYLDIHVARLGVDMMTLNGGKIYGPKQSGVLYVKGGISLRPLTQGGGQENGLRSGTENVAACVGFATALDIAQTARHNEGRRLQLLQQYFISTLAKRLPGAVINGSLKKRLPNNIHITVPGYDNERLLIQLESKKVLAAAGSACSASNDEPSHVLRAIGLDDGQAQASLRFSMGRGTTGDEVDQAIDALVTFSGQA
jgi:cysteine desulfurase